jgi:type I restriction enzyme, S subunit
MTVRICSLGDVAEIIAGQSPTGENYNAEGVGLPFYQGKKDFQEKYIGEPRVWTQKSTKVAQKDDVLMSVRAPVGPVNVATQECCIGRGLAAIRANKKDASSEYLYYFLLSMQNMLVSKKGTVFDSIRREQIEAIQIPVPDLEAQKDIVNWLKECFDEITELDSQVLAQEKRIAELTSSIIGQILTTQKGAEGLDYSLGEICDVDWGNTNLTKKSYVTDGDFAAVSAAGVDGRINHAEHRANTPVLSAIGANCGRMFLPTEDFTAIKNTITLTPRPEIVTGPYLYRLLQAIELPKRGAGQPFISKGDIQIFKVKILPLESQNAAIKSVDVALKEISTLASAYEAKKALISELKGSILNKAFGVSV